MLIILFSKITFPAQLAWRHLLITWKFCFNVSASSHGGVQSSELIIWPFPLFIWGRFIGAERKPKNLELRSLLFRDDLTPASAASEVAAVASHDDRPWQTSDKQEAEDMLPWQWKRWRCRDDVGEDKLSERNAHCCRWQQRCAECCRLFPISSSSSSQSLLLL